MAKTEQNTNKPRVGVSRCLLGDAVRYDGASKPSRIVIEQLGALFELTPVCPEVEAGLTIPRPPLQLTGSLEQPRMTGRDDPQLDVTETLQAFCEKRIPQLAGLSGFIFKSRSPSCGLASAPLFIDGECVTETMNGVFATALLKRYPQSPVIDELQLSDSAICAGFIKKVMAHHQTVTLDNTRLSPRP